jgi:1-acyl-sn-glycerol-3-phosphate acyltransferase
MRAPHVSLENVEQVNEYFSQVEPNKLLMHLLHFVMGRAVRAKTIFEGDAKQSINADLQDDRQIFMAQNHQDFFDQFVLASIIEREKVFNSMIGQIIIPGKSSEFNKYSYGWIVKRSGAVPIFRREEHGSDDEGVRTMANDSLVAIMQAHMNNGKHAAIYPEGTRGKDRNRDPRNLLEIREGIGRIACGLEDPDNVRIVCVGTVYGHDNRRTFQPVSVVSPPFPVSGNVGDVVDETRYNLQHAVDSAALYAGYGS